MRLSGAPIALTTTAAKAPQHSGATLPPCTFSISIKFNVFIRFVAIKLNKIFNDTEIGAYFFNLIRNQPLSQALIKQYENQILHLKEEVAFLRKQLEKND